MTKRGLVQNKGVYLDISNDNHLEEIFGLGDYTLLSVKNTTFEPLSPRSFVNYCIAAPQQSTDIWVMAGWEGDDLLMAGPGFNTLSGGSGADRFALLKSSV